MDEQIVNQEELNQAQPEAQKKKWNKTPFLIAGLVALTALLVVLAIPINRINKNDESNKPAVQVEKATLSISNPKSLGGNLYSADISVDSKKYTVSGADLIIKYDPKVVTNVKISNGSLLKTPTVLKTENDTTNGLATYSAVSGVYSPGVKGKGVFAVITFSLIGSPSATSLSFAPGTSVAAEGETSSVLGNAYGVNFSPAK